MSLWKNFNLNDPITSRDTLGKKSGLTGISSGLSTQGSGPTIPKPGMDPVMKMDLGLAGIDLLGSMFMGAQALNAKAPVIPRTPVPTLETPKIESGVAGEQALIKENMGIQTNTILNNAMETGQDMNTVGPGIFANANRAMRESTAQMSKENITTVNQQSAVTAEIANKNKIAAYEGDREYQARKTDVLSKDAIMRGQQMSMAFQNIGSIGSRLMNDFMLTDLIKKGNEQDNQADIASSMYRKAMRFNGTPL